jgi:hypothetical protein
MTPAHLDESEVSIGTHIQNVNYFNILLCNAF